MVGIPLSVPLGPAMSAAGRELLCLVASALGIGLLFAAGMASEAVDAWCAWRPWMRRVGLVAALALALGTLVTFSGGGFMLLHDTAADVYVTDIVSLPATDAELALAGRNPYTSDTAFRGALARFPDALATPLRGRHFGAGYDHPAPASIAAAQRRYAAHPSAVTDAFDPRTLHSYPALSFLLYAPVLWAGVGNILLLHVLVYWALFAWLVWRAPVGWRAWGALVALAAMPTVAASLIESNEVICIALLVTAWHARDRRWLFAVLLGLACAYKQYCWFFVPIFLLEVLLAQGWREAARRGALVAGVFLLPNLPYIIMGPGAWFQSLWLPMSEPLFATGVGVITLSVGHTVPYAPPVVYAVLEVAALGASLLAYARFRAQIGEAALVLALVPLFFAFRSLADYFAFTPWLALYAVNQVYRQRATAPLSPLGRLTVVDVRSCLGTRLAALHAPSVAVEMASRIESASAADMTGFVTSATAPRVDRAPTRSPVRARPTSRARVHIRRPIHHQGARWQCRGPAHGSAAAPNRER